MSDRNRQKLRQTPSDEQRIRALESELKKWLDAYPLSPNELRDALQFRVKGLEAELRDARAELLKDRNEGECYVCRECADRIRALEARVKELEAQVETSQLDSFESERAMLIARAEKAEAAVNGRDVRMSRLLLRLSEAEAALAALIALNPLNWDTVKERAAGRESGIEPVGTEHQSRMSSEQSAPSPRLKVQADAAAKSSAARHPSVLLMAPKIIDILAQHGPGCPARAGDHVIEVTGDTVEIVQEIANEMRVCACVVVRQALDALRRKTEEQEACY
jgi:hypothetical protein